MTKTNTRSRIVSILLVLMMLLTMVPITGVTANAADGFVEVSTYEQLKNEVDKGEAKVKLVANIDTTNENGGAGVTNQTTLKFFGNNNILDLNGHTLKLVSNTGATFIYVNKDLTIKDSSGTSGRIDFGYGPGIVTRTTAIYVSHASNEDIAHLTVESGTLSSTKGGITLIESIGNLTINGGKFYAPYEEGSGGTYAIHTIHQYNDNAKTIITGGEIDGVVFIQRDDSAATGTPNYGDIPVQIKGGTFKQHVQLRWTEKGKPSGNPTEFSPAVEIAKGIFEKRVNKVENGIFGEALPTKLTGGTFKDFPNRFGLGRGGKSDHEYYSKSLGNSIIVRGNEIRTSCDWSEADWFKVYFDCFYLLSTGSESTPVTVIPNAWGMKSVTLDGNPIDYFKDWNGTVERIDNSTAHTLKFEWYPLAQELKDAGYSYRAKCEHYISGSTAVQQTDTIAADKTSHTVTIPAGADPKVYSYDLQLNLQKDGSSVGIMANQHIVKLVVSDAPVAPPSLTGQVYYTSGIVYGSPISIAASVTPTSATPAYQWQRSTDGGSTWTNIEGATSGKYTPVAADMGENVRIRVKVTAEGYLGEIIGAAVKVSKVANNNYPEVIKLEAVKNGAGNYNGFKITNFDSDYEYVYSTTDTPNWSANQISSATVTGLTSNTTYYVFARFKETATHTAGSIVSKNSIMLYDYVPLDRVSLEGYDSGNTIYIKKGESVTLKVSADPSNANSWKEITFKDSSVSSLGTSHITISNEKIAASGTTATAFPNDHSITITGVSTGSATLDASYSGPTQPYYGRWYVVVYDDSTVTNALRLENVYTYADITLSENDEADLPTDLPTLLPANSGYHLEWRILKRGTYGATYVTENDNIKLEDVKIKPKAAHAASEKAQLELVAVKDGSTEYKTLPKTSLFYVTVTEAPVIELTGITVAPKKVNLDIGDTITLSAVKQPVNADGILSWASDKPKVATVDNNGKVIAHATPGTAIITVSCGDKKATCTVTVDHQHDYSGQPYLYLDPGSHYQECKAGDGYNIQAHEFSAWTDNGDGTHSRHCTVCKMTDGSTYTETAEHTWVWVVDQEPALNQPGKQHEECTGCHAKRSENTEIPALRDYAVTVTGGTATVAAGTTITRAMEGVEVTVTAQAPGGKHFVKWVVKAGGVTLANETSATTTFTMPANDVTIEAEFAENPVEAYTLTVIKGTASVAAGTPITDKIAQNTVVTVTADAPEADKVFDKWVVLEGNVTLADATKATTTFTMPGNDVKLEATYKDAPVTYSLTTQVNGGHGTISASKTGLAAGSTETIIFTPDAGYEIDTVTVNGVATGVLSNVLDVTMDADKTVVVTYKAIGSTHTHSYGTEWKYDGTNHWHECACGDKADTAAHSFQWVIDKAATKETTGIKHEECTVCGAKRSENTVIDKLPDGGNTGNTGSGDNNTDKPGKDDSTKSPQTGDNSNLIGWLAALFVSGGVLTLLGVSGKKRKESEAE